jgi:hypothetical protein
MIQIPNMLPLIAAGKFKVEIIRANGLREYFEFPNGITNEGKDNMLDVYFDNGTQITTWYMGMLDTTGSLAAGDTLASHAWGEINGYSGGPTRKTWNPDEPSGQAISNATPLVFTFTGTYTVRGLFICSVATGTSGKLWSTGAFPSNQVVNNGDSLNVVYGVTLT